jgi:hypothetical protein
MPNVFIVWAGDGPKVPLRFIGQMWTGATFLTELP